MGNSLIPKISLLSKAFYGLFLLALVASIVPFVPSPPLWMLRVSDAFVSNAPVFLLSTALLLLENHFQEDDYFHEDSTLLVVRRLRFWAALYALLIPLQLISYGWFWIDSGLRLQQQIGLAGSQLQSLKNRRQSNTVSPEASQDFKNSGRQDLGPWQSKPNQTEERSIKRFESDYQKIRSGLTDQRNKLLADLIPGILRTIIGSTIIAATLLAIARQF